MGTIRMMKHKNGLLNSTVGCLWEKNSHKMRLFLLAFISIIDSNNIALCRKQRYTVFGY